MAHSNAGGLSIMISNIILIKNILFLNNTAFEFSGGALISYSENIKIINCKFKGN